MKFRHALMLIAIAVASCMKAPTEPTAASDSAYSAAMFYETTSYLLPARGAWSADGDSLLIGSDANGSFNLYSLPARGGQSRALTTFNANSHTPVSWFPDDSRFLFSADEGGNELTHIFVQEPNGKVLDLTPGDAVKASFKGWTTDRKYFYVLTNERDASVFDLYRYRTDNYQRDMVFENTETWMMPAISRDGRYLVLYRENNSGDSDLFLMDLENPDADPQHITPHEGRVLHQAFSFTPDNQALVYGTDEHGEFIEAWTHDIATDKKTLLRRADWDIKFLYFTDSGKYQVTGINEDARLKIFIEETSTGKPLPLPKLPPGHLSRVNFNADDSRIALMINTDTSPKDIYVIGIEDQSVVRLTEAMSPGIDESRLVSSEIVRYRSFDGLEIPSVLYKPRGATQNNPVPALVWVHGGPGGQSTPGYFPLIQHLVNHGYAILMANNRGSSGYGKTFFHMDDRKHGTVDLDDIVYAGRYLAGLDWVDGDRVGVMGGSYGGYMVVAALAFRHGEFKVGVDIFGVMNWVRTLESIPAWWEFMRKRLYDELGDPATDRERLLEVSPLAHANRIRTPLLVVQGANDPRVLKTESDEIVAALRANGVPVEYLVFDDEGHGFRQKANRIAASEAYLSFLKEHL
jgi:prolyl oligopeptidase